MYRVFTARYRGGIAHAVDEAAAYGLSVTVDRINGWGDESDTYQFTLETEYISVAYGLKRRGWHVQGERPLAKIAIAEQRIARGIPPTSRPRRRPVARVRG